MDVAAYADAYAAEGLRGDYRYCRDDFTIPQDYRSYSDVDHAVWRHLYARQHALTATYANTAFLDGLRNLQVGERIPSFDDVNEELHRHTGWTLVAVPGLIPGEAFFAHLAARRFPTTNWIRPPEELDYIVEPDLFHDFFGHVPLLTLPVFADFMQLYGEIAHTAATPEQSHAANRLYWYTAEYGLIREGDGALKAFGAGLMSSAGELPHAVTGPGVTRRPADFATMLRTDAEIDKYQKVYFVLDSFESLFDALRDDGFDAMLAEAASLPALDPATL